MGPTSDQIRHAAYERWLRRGRIHGHHDTDWYGAEKELAFLLNYQTIAEYPLASGERRILGDLSIRRCRFCERTADQVAFGPARAVVPGLSGNPSLFTAEVCDDCQGDWRDPLDDELRGFWEALRADGVGLDAHGQPPAGPIFSIGVFKALIAGAILILPETELPAVVDTMEWVSNPDHDCDDHLFAGSCCQVYSAPFLKDLSGISLARRVQAEAPLPDLLYFLGHGGIVVQVPVPLCLRDQDLDGRDVHRPERSLTGSAGPDFQEARSTVLPLALSRRRPRRELRRPSIAS
jgi:hypothetical protein